MKTYRLMIISAVLTGLFAVSSFAQAGSGKLAVINTLEFGAAKGGITKYINAQKRLNNEFKVENQQLQTLANRINALKKEIATLQKPANPNVPVSTATLTQKAQQHDSLAREFKFKEENAKAKYNARFAAIMGPVNKDISNAMQQFAKQKGYAMILDAARLDQAGLILAFDRQFDVTKAFIAFYNTRPGGTASTTTP